MSDDQEEENPLSNEMVKMVSQIKQKAQGTPLEDTLEIIFNLMLVYCNKRRSFLLEVANFSEMSPEDLLYTVRDLYPFFNYTIEHWNNGQPWRVFIHRLPLLTQLDTETHDEWVGRNLGFECLGIPDPNLGRYDINYSIEDDAGTFSNFYTEICPLSVDPASFSKQKSFQQVATLVNWTVHEYVGTPNPDSYWLEGAKHAFEYPQCPETQFFDREDSLIGFLSGSGIDIFNEIPLKKIIEEYYPWLVMSLLSIKTDPLEHLYTLSKKDLILLDKINEDTFEKFKRMDPPFVDDESGGQTLYMTLHPDFLKLFDTEDDEKKFREVEQEIIDQYSDFMGVSTPKQEHQQMAFLEEKNETDESLSETEDLLRDDILTTIIENPDFSRYHLMRLIIDADFCLIRPNINSFNKFDETPLMTAVRVGDKDMVRLLLWKDADPHLTNSENQTAFDFAQQHPDGVELERILVEHYPKREGSSHQSMAER